MDMTLSLSRGDGEAGSNVYERTTRGPACATTACCRLRRRCARQRSKTICWRSSRIRSSIVYGGRRSSSVSWRLSAVRGVVRPHAIQRPLKKGDIHSAIGSLTFSLVVCSKNYTKRPETPKKRARRVRSFCGRISTGEGQRGRRLSGKAEQGYGVRCGRRMPKNAGGQLHESAVYR